MKKDLAQKLAFALALTLIAGWVSESVAQDGMAAQAKSKSEKAAEFLAQNGDEGLKQISDPGSDWAQAPYVFVYDMNGKIIGHPNNKLIGKDFLGVKDVKGKLFAAEFLATAKSDAGHGWVDYWWPKLNSKEAELKVSYILKVPGKEMFVGAGINGYTIVKAVAEAGE